MQGIHVWATADRALPRKANPSPPGRCKATPSPPSAVLAATESLCIVARGPSGDGLSLTRRRPAERVRQRASPLTRRSQSTKGSGRIDAKRRVSGRPFSAFSISLAAEQLVKTPHRGPLFSSIFENSRQNKGQAPFYHFCSDMLRGYTKAIITPMLSCARPCGRVRAPGPTLSAPKQWKSDVSARVRHDSGSTVAFKFQAHRLFNIFKFDVRDFGFGGLEARD